jgi:uncharacterized membrane protein (DUF4010 family)
LQTLTLTVGVEALAAALLVGLLIGAQREAAGGEQHPGLRDFMLVALAGGLCGLLANPWLDAVALAAISGTFAVFHWEHREKRSGITTELAAAATFLLALFAASGATGFSRPLAIGVAILITVFLEARQRLHTLLQKTITESEFNATLWFVVVVLVIYPLLPEGSYGLYHFFIPTQIWRFVILISSISYLGYFLEKFLGEEKGLFYTSMLGGLASTTAVTIHFARKTRENPEETFGLWRVFVVANTVQFPRTALIAGLASPELLRATAWPLAAMTLVGVGLAWALGRWPHKRLQTLEIQSSNPFRIRPALQFGALFTAVVFIAKVSTVKLGASAFYGTSLIGGLVDVATVIAPASDMMGSHRISADTAAIAVLLALASNAALKIMIAAALGRKEFAAQVTASFLLWAAAGATAWFLVTKI